MLQAALRTVAQAVLQTVLRTVVQAVFQAVLQTVLQAAHQMMIQMKYSFPSSLMRWSERLILKRSSSGTLFSLLSIWSVTISYSVFPKIFVSQMLEGFSRNWSVR